MTVNSYRLLDTGYANKTASGTQETRANSGNALSLSVDDISWRRGSGTSSAANPARYEDTETNFVSIKNPVLIVSGFLDKASATYNAELAALDDMCTTKGVKHFYYSSTTDGYKPITSVKGATSHGSLSVGGGIKSLLVRVLEFNFNERKNAPTKGLQKYTITLEVTNLVTAT